MERDEQTGEFLLTGMGELHIRSAVERLGRFELHPFFAQDVQAAVDNPFFQFEIRYPVS
ncbi:MAG: hypothetical protein ACE5GG_04690 [Candidatus Omnitrophota bacterium]